MSDLAVLRDQARAVRAGGLGPDAVAGAGRDRPGPAGTDRGRASEGPPARVGVDRGPARADPALARWPTATSGTTIVIRMDATIQIAHSDKQQAAGTFKGTWGHHSLTAWCDNTSESLAFRLRPGNAGSNTAVDHIEVARRGDRAAPGPVPAEPADHLRRCGRHPGPGPPHHHAERRTRAAGALLGRVRPRPPRPHRDRPALRLRLGPGARSPRHSPATPTTPAWPS